MYTAHISWKAFAEYEKYIWYFYIVFCIDNGLCPMIAHVQQVSDSVPLLDSQFKLVTQFFWAVLNLLLYLIFNWKTAG